MNVRPFTDEDADAVADLINRDDARLYGRPPRLSASDLLGFRHWWKEAWIWEDDGRIAANATFGVHGGAAHIRGIVDAKGRGIGTEIVARGEAFAKAQGLAKVHAGFPEPDAAARALFESRGYREVRRFWEMAIELEQEPAVPTLRDGLVLEELGESDTRPFYDALNDAFAEHWEWHPMPYDEWLELRRGQHHDEHGPLWFAVRDGDEIAAVTRNELRSNEGYVGAIGVRPAWRGQGLAKVLLHRTFAEFWRRGLPRITLDVDAQNETGATQLYERVGMHVETCHVAVEKT